MSRRLLASFALLATALMLIAAVVEGKVIVGTGKSDKINGTKKNDRINAGAGNDRVRAKAGNDKVRGGKGNDGAGGGRGNDKLFGNAGADKLSGAQGNDRLNGGKGRDKLGGGKGNDIIGARDGAADAKVNGGPGIDICKIDFEDVLRTTGCERFGPSRPADPGPGGPGYPGYGGPGPGSGPGGPSGQGPGVPGPAGPGPGGDDLTITEFTGNTCDEGEPPPGGGQPPCPFTLQGTGANTSGGEVSASAEITLHFGGAESDPSGSGQWAGGGFYNCTADGSITVAFGTESVVLPITCIPPGGVAPNEPLTITTPPPVPCDDSPAPSQSPGNGCVGFDLVGTGADQPAGLITGTPGSGVVASGDIVADPATGSWMTTDNNGAICQPNGELIPNGLTVTVGTEMATIDLQCGE